MEIRVIWRGALSGFVAGAFAFLFAKIFVESQINAAIDYESGRDEILDKLNKAAGRGIAPDGPEIFSRHFQSTIGLATGLIGFGTAMGAIMAVAYLVLHGRLGIRPRTTALLIGGFGFLGVYLLPFVKYPANPPAIGHTFTIVQRSHLYLSMVGASIVLLGLAIYLGYRLRTRFGVFHATLLAAAAFLVPYCVLVGVLPSLGNLSENVSHADQFGFGRSSTETPQAITNVLHRSLTVDGRTIAPGQIVYPGFPADVLWKFRWYSIIDQLIIWTGTSLIFGAFLQRFFRDAYAVADEPEPVSSLA